MKSLKLTLFLLFLLSQAFVIAQHDSFCAIDQFMDKTVDLSKMPDRENITIKDDIIYVRTVFHVLYDNLEENFSDEQIFNLMDTLNMIFSGAHVDTPLIHPQHRALVHDSKIRFCLASIDPNDQPTNGITRTKMELFSYFPTNRDTTNTVEVIKTDSLGGKSPWDTKRYFNIWIGPMEDENTFYNYGVPLNSYYPLGAYVKEGIPGAVIDNKNILDRGFGFGFYGPGVLAHECGHALGLAHTWGLTVDSVSLDFCLTDDFMNDTPTSGPSFSCYNFGEENSCIDSIGDKPDNQANIMAYACMRMTTPDQSTTMRSNLMQSQDLWMTEDECNAFVSTKNKDLEEDLKIYPNPNDGRFYIDFPQENFKEMKVSLFNIQGKKEFSQIIQSVEKGSVIFDLNENSKGLFFLKIEIDNQSLVRKVFIK